MPDSTVGLTWDLFKIDDGSAQYRMIVDGSDQSLHFKVSDRIGNTLIHAKELSI